MEGIQTYEEKGVTVIISGEDFIWYIPPSTYQHQIQKVFQDEGYFDTDFEYYFDSLSEDSQATLISCMDVAGTVLEL